MDQQWLNTYREEIGGFSNTIHSFAQGEIARKDYANDRVLELFNSCSMRVKPIALALLEDLSKL